MLLTIIPLFSHDIASEKCLHILWNFKHRIPLSGMIKDLCCSSLRGKWSLVQISLNDDIPLLPHHILHQLSSDERTWTRYSSLGALIPRRQGPEVLSLDLN